MRADDDTPALAAAPAKEETFALPAAPAKPAKETKPGECSSGPRPAPPRDYDHCEDILLDDIFENDEDKLCRSFEQVRRAAARARAAAADAARAAARLSRRARRDLSP